jgi:hypothetical protein
VSAIEAVPPSPPLGDSSLDGRRSSPASPPPPLAPSMVMFTPTPQRWGGGGSPALWGHPEALMLGYPDLVAPTSKSIGFETLSLVRAGSPGGSTVIVRWRGDCAIPAGVGAAKATLVSLAPPRSPLDRPPRPIAVGLTLPARTAMLSMCMPIDAVGLAAPEHAGTALSHHTGCSSCPSGAASDGEAGQDLPGTSLRQLPSQRCFIVSSTVL